MLENVKRWLWTVALKKAAAHAVPAIVAAVAGFATAHQLGWITIATDGDTTLVITLNLYEAAGALVGVLAATLAGGMAANKRKFTKSLDNKPSA